jgi:hypothetical protein
LAASSNIYWTLHQAAQTSGSLANAVAVVILLPSARNRASRLLKHLFLAENVVQIIDRGDGSV